jgi:ATP-binding cassette subfamily B protein
MEGRTTIAIAHRLSTILRADRILVYERAESSSGARRASGGDGLYARLARTVRVGCPPTPPVRRPIEVPA